MALVEVTAPAAEPVSLTEAKAHLRVDAADEDALITSLIVAVRQYVEQFTRRALVTQTWDMVLDCFPTAGGRPILVPKPPLRSVGSVKYIDADGVEATWDSAKYRVDAKSQPGRITPAWGEVWPTARFVTNAVTVQFDAGYGAASAVPTSIKQAMLLLVGHWFEHRESVVIGAPTAQVPMAVEMLLWPYRDLSGAGAQ